MLLLVNNGFSLDGNGPWGEDFASGLCIGITCLGSLIVIGELAPDFLMYFRNNEMFYGTGFKISFGYSFATADFKSPSDEWYILSPRMSNVDQEEYNTWRLEWYPELIITNAHESLYFGLISRFYFPIGYYFALHVSSGVYFNQAGIAGTVGAGMHVYFFPKTGEFTSDAFLISLHMSYKTLIFNISHIEHGIDFGVNYRFGF